jgi:hypothetical protein
VSGSRRSKLALTDLERERRRRLARELHAQGKFGGRQRGAGRPPRQAKSGLTPERLERLLEARWGSTPHFGNSDELLRLLFAIAEDPAFGSIPEWNRSRLAPILHALIRMR